MKYLVSYLLTASLMTGIIWVGYYLVLVLSGVLGDDVNWYLLYLGAALGLAGPIGLYINDKKEKKA